MANFTKLEQSLRHVSALPDRPSLTEGYTAEVIKGVFDRAAEEIKAYINDVLIRDLASDESGDSCSEKLGARSIEGVEGNTVYMQMKSIAEKIGDLTLGAIPDKSISAEKLQSVLLNRFEGLTVADTVYKEAGNYTFTVPRTGYYRIVLCGGGAAGSLYSPDQSSVSLTHRGFGGASGAYGEFIQLLCEGDEIEVTVGAGGSLNPPAVIGQSFSGSERLFIDHSGKASTFGSLSAEGGRGYTEYREEARATGGGMTLYKNGKAQSCDVFYHDGLDSFIGNGARRVSGEGIADFVYDAGIGGGGCGFVYTDDAANTSDTVAEDRVYRLDQHGSAGGDGLVLIRYLHVLS